MRAVAVRSRRLLKWSLIGLAWFYTGIALLGIPLVLFGILSHKSGWDYTITFVNDTGVTLTLYGRCSDPRDFGDVFDFWRSAAKLCAEHTVAGVDDFPPLTARPGESATTGAITVPWRRGELLFAFVSPTRQIVGCISTHRRAERQLRLRVSSAAPCPAGPSGPLSLDD